MNKYTIKIKKSSIAIMYENDECGISDIFVFPYFSIEYIVKRGAATIELYGNNWKHICDLSAADWILLKTAFLNFKKGSK